MKKIKLFILFSALYSVGFSQSFTKMENDSTQADNIEFAKTFANDFFTANKGGSTYDFKDNAIEPVKASMTADKQKATYENLKKNYGDYQSSKYAETWTNGMYSIIRLKGKFDKSDDELEIRVVLDNNKKIAGFFIKPWAEGLR